MRFSRQESWSGLPFPGGLQVIFLTQGLNQHLLWLLWQILHHCTPWLQSAHGVAKIIRHDLATKQQQQGGDVTIQRGEWWGKVWAGEVSLGALQRPSGYNQQRGDGEETLQNPHTGVGGGGGGGGDPGHSKWAGGRRERGRKVRRPAWEAGHSQCPVLLVRSKRTRAMGPQCSASRRSQWPWGHVSIESRGRESAVREEEPRVWPQKWRTLAAKGTGKSGN